MKIKSLLAASAATLLTLPALAVNVAVTNASFETLGGPYIASATDGFGTANWNFGPVPGWNSLVLGYGIGQSNLGGYAGNPAPSDGVVFAYIEGGGSLTQNVGVAAAGTTYTLNVDVLHRTDVAMTGTVSLQLAGLTVATASTVDAGPGTWNLHTLSWTALAGDAGKTVTILLAATGTQGDFDNVRMTAAPVPEPETYALMLAGLGVFAFMARRRQSR